MGAMLI